MAKCGSSDARRWTGAAAVLAALIAALIAAMPALAQQGTDGDSQAAAGALHEIIVTAEKHSESLQKVPLSIVAFTAETLAETGVEDFASLAARIPGVTLEFGGTGAEQLFDPRRRLGGRQRAHHRPLHR